LFLIGSIVWALSFVVLLNTPYLKLQRPTAEIAKFEIELYAVLTEKRIG
jgi:hypothetical protein